MESQKVMEAAYNFTDTVIENKDYTIEKSACVEGCYFINISHGTLQTSIAAFVAPHNIFSEMLPIRFAHQQQLVLECLKYDSELKAVDQREKELKEEFEIWRRKYGK